MLIDCCACGEPLYQDCSGRDRCPVCDQPCPCCDDGPPPTIVVVGALVDGDPCDGHHEDQDRRAYREEQNRRPHPSEY